MNKITRHLLNLFIATLLILSCKGTSEKNNSNKVYINGNADLIVKKISRVENGLIHAVLVADQPKQTFNINDRLEYFNVPGVSIAVIKDNEIEWAKSYGVKSKNTNDSVTIKTLFQAASLSKPITATVVLKLVERGIIDLDLNVNQQLQSWKILESDLTKKQPVTPRNLILHTSGLGVPHYPGYSFNDTLPDIIDILNGQNHSNTEPVTVQFKPNSKWRYSGAGYTILQLLLSDKMELSFPEVMENELFKPLEITNSTFRQKELTDIRQDVALAHLENGEIVKNGYHLYPEMAAAGLWTTPLDYAKIVCEIQKAYQGKSDLILSDSVAKNALSRHYWDMGLGFFLSDSGDSIAISYSGGNHGYTCEVYSYLKRGSGAVIMTNSNNGGPLIEEILSSISEEYDWVFWQPDTITPIFLDNSTIEQLKGTYIGQSRENKEFTFDISGRSNNLTFETSGKEYQIYAVSEKKFVIPEQDWKIWIFDNDSNIDSVRYKIDLYGRGVARKED